MKKLKEYVLITIGFLLTAIAFEYFLDYQLQCL